MVRRVHLTSLTDGRLLDMDLRLWWSDSPEHSQDEGNGHFMPENNEFVHHGVCHTGRGLRFSFQCHRPSLSLETSSRS